MTNPSTSIVPVPPGKVKPTAPTPNPSDLKTAVANSDLKALRASNPTNFLQRLRLERGIPVRDLVEVVQTIYPKYDKTLHSKCEHGYDYGIRFRADAVRALREHFAPAGPDAPRKPHRSKPCRVQVRLTDSAYSALQQAVSRSQITMQALLEQIITDYIRRERGDTHEAEN